MANLTPACVRIQGSLWRYIDRELSAPALAEISAHLKACADCGRVFEARSCDAKLYRMAFVDSPFGEAFVERFRRRLDGEPAAARGGAAAGGAARGSRLRSWLPEVVLANPRKFLARAALAAALMTIGASVIFGLRPDASLGTLVSRGNPAMERGGRSISGLARDLRPGDRFYLDGADDELRIALNDGSALVLTGPADLLIDDASRPEGRFIAKLDEGELRAAVTHRGKEREMKVYSPDAEARVVGTRFTLRVEPNRGTELQVEEGEVMFRWYGGKEIPVNPATGPSFASSSREKPVPAAPASPAAAGIAGPAVGTGAPGETGAQGPAAASTPADLQPPAAGGQAQVLDQPAAEKPVQEVPVQIKKGVDLPAR